MSTTRTMGTRPTDESFSATTKDAAARSSSKKMSSMNSSSLHSVFSAGSTAPRRRRSVNRNSASTSSPTTGKWAPRRQRQQRRQYRPRSLGSEPLNLVSPLDGLSGHSVEAFRVWAFEAPTTKNKALQRTTTKSSALLRRRWGSVGGSKTSPYEPSMVDDVWKNKIVPIVQDCSSEQEFVDGHNNYHAETISVLGMEDSMMYLEQEELEEGEEEEEKEVEAEDDDDDESTIDMVPPHHNRHWGSRSIDKKKGELVSQQTAKQPEKTEVVPPVAVIQTTSQHNKLNQPPQLQAGTTQDSSLPMGPAGSRSKNKKSRQTSSSVAKAVGRETQVENDDNNKKLDEWLRDSSSASFAIDLSCDDDNDDDNNDAEEESISVHKDGTGLENNKAPSQEVSSNIRQSRTWIQEEATLVIAEDDNEDAEESSSCDDEVNNNDNKGDETLLVKKNDNQIPTDSASPQQSTRKKGNKILSILSSSWHRLVPNKSAGQHSGQPTTQADNNNNADGDLSFHNNNNNNNNNRQLFRSSGSSSRRLSLRSGGSSSRRLLLRSSGSSRRLLLSSSGSSRHLRSSASSNGTFLQTSKAYRCQNDDDDDSSSSSQESLSVASDPTAALSRANNGGGGLDQEFYKTFLLEMGHHGVSSYTQRKLRLVEFVPHLFPAGQSATASWDDDDDDNDDSSLSLASSDDDEDLEVSNELRLHPCFTAPHHHHNNNNKTAIFHMFPTAGGPSSHTKPLLSVGRTSKSTAAVAAVGQNNDKLATRWMSGDPPLHNKKNNASSSSGTRSHHLSTTNGNADSAEFTATTVASAESLSCWSSCSTPPMPSRPASSSPMMVLERTLAATTT